MIFSLTYPRSLKYMNQLNNLLFIFIEEYYFDDESTGIFSNNSYNYVNITLIVYYECYYWDDDKLLKWNNKKIHFIAKMESMRNMIGIHSFSNQLSPSLSPSLSSSLTVFPFTNHRSLAFITTNYHQSL